MRKDGGDVEAARAFDIHEERVGALNEALKLVLSLLVAGRGVQEILRHYAICALRGCIQ